MVLYKINDPIYKKLDHCKLISLLKPK